MTTIYLVVEGDNEDLAPMVAEDVGGDIYTVRSVHATKEAARRIVYKRTLQAGWLYNAQEDNWGYAGMWIAIREFQLQ